MSPPQQGQFASILKLVETNTLTIEKLVHYLNKHYGVDGVRDFLINQLYERSNKEASFYIPEIV